MGPGGCCADSLLQRHVLEREPGEGLQPAGPSSCLRLAQRRPVSACMAMAKLTPCAWRGARAGCSLRCKGICSPCERHGDMGASHGGTHGSKPCPAMDYSQGIPSP